MENTLEKFNVGFSDQQVCKIIKLYVKDNVNGQDLAAQFKVESNLIYTVLHNYGFNRERTAGKSNVRGIFGPIFARYSYTEEQIDDCIYKYMLDYRKKYSPDTVDFYLQDMLSNLGKQLETQRKRTSNTLQNTWQSRGSSQKVWDSESMAKYGIIAAAIIVVIGIIWLMRSCSFDGNKLSGMFDFFSNGYEFEAFTYDGIMYAGNKTGNKPNGVCAGIPLRSSGTSYSLGEYDGSKMDGFGIVCSSDIPLQSEYSEKKDASDYDEAVLNIRMGQMKKSVLNGYGVIFNSSEGIVIGKYKEGQLKKYGCNVSLDENGNILSVDVVKGDKVKKHLETGTYKGITYYPEEGLIVIEEFEFTISEGQISLKTEGVNMSIKDRQWAFDLFNADTEEGIYIEYDLGENIKCEVITNDSKGIRVNESEMPITYGKKDVSTEDDGRHAY